MRKIVIPIFTEEYKIVVAVGKLEELAKYISNNCVGWNYSEGLAHVKRTRGSAFNLLVEDNPRHPLITLDVDLPYEQALATLPHEASHCADYIFDYLGIIDKSGEMRGHIISAVVRKTLKSLLNGKTLIAKKTNLPEK